MKLGRYFHVKCEEVSSISVEFLDVRVNILQDRFQVQPKFKDASLARPLEVSSIHPRHVHESWPRGVASRLISLASDAAAAREAVEIFSKRLRDFHHPPSIVNAVEQTLHSNRSSSANIQPMVRIVLPYHPAWAPFLERAVRELNNDACWKQCYYQAFNITDTGAKLLGIAWKGVLPNLERRLCHG